ncbi:protein-disulfide reductase DsbD family protein [Rhodocaloribacter litoris]|uniref:protein-disulfide reductase DsbD family protein n=1 Tax=Rhodocaloribacter litoris TaxID=2558931 RepID=UPI001E39A177|nr:cytochrome c biogenesis protein CcdA [Rhodocaloribacter litoris]
MMSAVRIRKRLPALLLLAVCMGGGTVAAAQEIGRPSDYVAWQARAVPQGVAPGGQVQLLLSARIADGWKMYAMDSPPPSQGVQVHLEEPPPGFTLSGALTQSPPAEAFDPYFKTNVRFFKEKARFAAVYRVGGDVSPGTYELSGRARYQICNDELGVCLPPAPAPFTVAVVVDPGCDPARAGAGECPVEMIIEGDGFDATGLEAPRDLRRGTPGVPGAASPGNDVAPTDLEAATAGGLWTFLLLAFGAGLAALLTPCVFPMIPLTISYFTKHAGRRSEALRMASVYGASIVLTFTGLGVIMAVVVGAAGAQTIAANPWVNLFIALVLVAFGLSLLGLYELRLPAGLLNYVNRQSHTRRGYVGVLFMGLTLTLVSFSCTAPFVGGLLAAAAGGTWVYPLLGMFAFSLAFALPFVLLALFPKALGALPRSGSWMNAVKVTLGFVELAAALKFLSNADLVWGWGILSRPLAIALTTVLFFLAGLYLIGVLRLAHEPAPETVGVGRLLAAVACFGLSLYLLPGLFGAPLNRLDAFLPPRQGTDVSLAAALRGRAEPGGTGEEAWFVNDLEGALARARRENKPVFIDFTGYTCTNCREMEATVFPHPDVAKRFERDYVLLRLYTDDLNSGERWLNYQLRLTGTVALPTYAVVDPVSEKLLVRKSGLLKVEAFLALLENGTARFRQMHLAAG